MSVAFFKGQVLTSADLKIVIRNSSGVPVDPYYIRYALFDYTTGIDVLIGVPNRIPATTGTGQYFVDAQIPLDANIGDWIVRWNFNETTTSPLVEVAQDFNVVSQNVTTAIAQTTAQDVLLRRLRIFLRDNNPDRNYSVDGKEKIKIKTKDKTYVVSLEELWEIVENGRKNSLYIEAKKDIYKNFIEGSLQVQSVSKDKKVEWKRIIDVLQHDVTLKDQYCISVNNGQVRCSTTGDHSLYRNKEQEIEELFVREAVIGDKLAVVDEGKVIDGILNSLLLIPSIKFMYDLSVEDNHNFVLLSGLVAHNTFRPPATEKFMQTQTQVFGYLWEDEELYEYLLGAVDELNSSPPVTGVTLDTLPDRWRTNVLMRAAAFACGAMTMTWNVNEFDYSISGVSLSIEKSSKYESMKNNFLQEWDKSRELIKASIKIIKGLQQPRYGVGISSALGPYSRPGTQSRRNFSSGGRGGWS